MSTSRKQKKGGPTSKRILNCSVQSRIGHEAEVLGSAMLMMTTTTMMTMMMMIRKGRRRKIMNGRRRMRTTMMIKMMNSAVSTLRVLRA
jgi:hypothetical protein